MIFNAMNPIKRTMLILLAWILAIFLFLSIRCPCGGDAFIYLVYGFYLMPFVGLISFGIQALIFRKWVLEYRNDSIVFGLLLLGSCITVVLYILSLFE